MRLLKINLLILVLALLCLCGSAIAGKDADQPGYIDLSFIEIPDDADEIQDIDLGPVLKDVVREAKANDDLEIAELLAMVHNLRLRSFSVDQKSAGKARKSVEKITARMKADDWDTLMKFKDGDELTTINIKYHKDNMVGLTVVVFDPTSEVLFVNVVGDLDLGKLMKLAGQLDSGELEEYLDQMDGVHNIHID